LNDRTKIERYRERGDALLGIGISFFASRRYSSSLAENSPAELIYKFITQEKLHVKAEKSGQKRQVEVRTGIGLRTG
jgi:hypothetical protein